MSIVRVIQNFIILEIKLFAKFTKPYIDKLEKGKCKMNESKMMNVLVLGASGAGKSTLIKAISGAEVMTGVGEGNTQKIDVYESNTWSIRCIDTKGFEYNIFEQWKTIRQVKKYTKSQLSNKEEIQNNEVGIDAVWYCVEGTARRTFAHNIMLMNKAIRGWKNIPVFAVITKSYSEKDIPENIEAIQQAFAKLGGVNLKKIIPVVAEEYTINDDVRVAPMGIEELCLNTLDCMDEAKNINKENRDRMILEQKRFTANATTIGATATAFTIGAMPLNFADSQMLVPIEVGLATVIFKIYGVKISNEIIKAIIGSSAITLAAKQVVTLAKSLPIAGDIVNGAVAGAFMLALGEGIIAVSEGIYTGKIDSTQTDKIAEIIGENIKENPIINATMEYFEKNSDKISEKSSKEIFNEIKKSVNNPQK